MHSVAIFTFSERARLGVTIYCYVSGALRGQLYCFAMWAITLFTVFVHGAARRRGLRIALAAWPTPLSSDSQGVVNGAGLCQVCFWLAACVAQLALVLATRLCAITRNCNFSVLQHSFVPRARRTATASSRASGRAWLLVYVLISLPLQCAMLAFVIARVTHKLKVWRARFGYPQRFQILATRLPQAVARASARAHSGGSLPLWLTVWHAFV